MTGAIFDMDGLLFDTERIFQETWGELAIENGHPLDEFFAGKICGASQEISLQTLREYYPGKDPQDVSKECWRRMRLKLETFVPVKKGAEEILRAFRENGYKLAVASSTDAKQIEHNLVLTGLRSYFDEIISGQEVKNGKPHPDIFLLAAKRIGCRPEDCYIFEDSLNGVRAGYAAGCKTIMIPDLIAPTEDVRQAAFGIYESLAEARKELLP